VPDTSLVVSESAHHQPQEWQIMKSGVASYLNGQIAYY
jgi:hypothetical protein